jgi:hypothetical protein
MAQDPSPSLPVRLRPPLVVQIGNAVGSLVILGAAASLLWFSFATPAGHRAFWLTGTFGIIIGLVGVGLVVRWPRMGVLLTDDRVTLVGFFRTTSIPRRAVQQVTGYPSIVWTDSTGRTRDTIVAALKLDSSRGSPNPAVVALMNQRIAALQRWAS